MKVVDAEKLYRGLFNAKTRREAKLRGVLDKIHEDRLTHGVDPADEVKEAILESEIGLLIIICAEIEGAEVVIPEGGRP
jgi:hypothetical protein